MLEFTLLGYCLRRSSFKLLVATTSDPMLNIVHDFNSLYRIPHPVQDQTMAYANTADDVATRATRNLNEEWRRQ